MPPPCRYVSFMFTTEGSNTMTITPRTCIAAAMFLGDNATARYCPTGIGNAGTAQLEALVREAVAQGMEA